MSYLYDTRSSKKSSDYFAEMTCYNPEFIGSREDQVGFRLASNICENMSVSLRSFARLMARSALVEMKVKQANTERKHDG